MCGFCFFLSAAIEDLQALYKLAVGFDGVVSVNVYAKPRKPVSWYKMTSDGSKSLLIKQNDKFELEGDLKGYNITGRGTLVIKDVSKSDDGKYEMRVQVVGSQIKKETEILVGSKWYYKESKQDWHQIQHGILSGYDIPMMRCAIWYHLHNLKNVTNTHGGVLLLGKPATLLKVTLLHGCFSRFLNCKWHQIVENTTYMSFYVLVCAEYRIIWTR